MRVYLFQLIEILNASEEELMITKRKNSGFTLIELLVVLSIMAILIAVALPKYVDVQEKVKLIKLSHDLEVMGTAVDVFYANVGLPPARVGNFGDPGLSTSQVSQVTILPYVMNTLNSFGSLSLNEYTTLLEENWAGPYMEAWPKPPIGDKYYYNIEKKDIIIRIDKVPSEYGYGRSEKYLGTHLGFTGTIKESILQSDGTYEVYFIIRSY